MPNNHDILYETMTPLCVCNIVIVIVVVVLINRAHVFSKLFLLFTRRIVNVCACSGVDKIWLNLVLCTSIPITVNTTLVYYMIRDSYTNNLVFWLSVDVISWNNVYICFQFRESCVMHNNWILAKNVYSVSHVIIVFTGLFPFVSFVIRLLYIVYSVL